MGNLRNQIVSQCKLFFSPQLQLKPENETVSIDRASVSCDLKGKYHQTKIREREVKK